VQSEHVPLKPMSIEEAVEALDRSRAGAVVFRNTDSERAFCFILQTLRNRFIDRTPTQDELFAAMRELSASIAGHGEFNFLLSNGDFLFAHCASKLSYIIRQAPFSVAHLKDQDVSIDFSEVTTDNDRVAVIATTPLTDNEQWTALQPGSLALFVHGALVCSS